MHAAIIGTYELGRQPFGLASPAAWLERDGWSVRCLDLAVDAFDEELVAAADLLAIHLPMHTATRLAVPVARRVRKLNPTAHLCFYGLYAPMNESLLRRLGANSIVGGEFEMRLVEIARRVRREPTGTPDFESFLELDRQDFIVPRRDGLSALERYGHLDDVDGMQRVVGYTEASRGCRHTCRHCPIVPIYGGRFRIVSRDVVLADIAQQVAQGASHITFGDPDFFNGPGHAIPLVQELHERFPDVSYDVTIKIEHLLKHRRHLDTLRMTGCAFVTSAVEAVDDEVLERFDKRHTRADFIQVAALMREHDLPLIPTFVTFTPWTTASGYLDLLALVAELDLVDHVPPVQWAIRLLIPAGSKLLDLPEVEALVERFDEAALCYPWRHPDPDVDRLHDEVRDIVKAGLDTGIDRRAIFERIWGAVSLASGSSGTAPDPAGGTSHAAVPSLSEPWYCCAEPTDDQLAPHV